MSNENTAETMTIPAGPSDERQRAYLTKLIDLTETLTRTLNEAIAHANNEIAGLAAGTVIGTGRGSGVARVGADALALRTEISTMARLHRGWGLTAEQVQHAIHLGATQNSLLDDGAAAWLYTHAPAKG